MLQLLTIVGARPQFIKYAAIAGAFRQHTSHIQNKLLHTGQHYDYRMSDVFFRELQLNPPDFRLETGSGNPAFQTARMMQGIEEILLSLKPNAVLVFGDTNSTLAGALSAVKLHIPLIHVEAGLRSFKKEMPEEINRVLTDHSSTLLCCPTRLAMDNLHREGFTPSHGIATLNHPATVMTGDVMYDIFIEQTKYALPDNPAYKFISKDQPYILSTLHRAGNTDQTEVLLELLKGIEESAKSLNMPAYLPLHPRTNSILKQLDSNAQVKAFNSSKWIYFDEPSSYPVFLRLLKDCSLVMTDAGGVQKEAYFSKKPCVILRDETEWVELTDAGFAALGGTKSDSIQSSAERMIQVHISEHSALYGDGNAAEKICKEIEYHFG